MSGEVLERNKKIKKGGSLEKCHPLDGQRRMGSRRLAGVLLGWTDERQHYGLSLISNPESWVVCMDVKIRR